MTSAPLTETDEPFQATTLDVRRRVLRLTRVRQYGEIVGVMVKYGFVDVVRTLHLTSYLAAGRRATVSALPL